MNAPGATTLCDAAREAGSTGIRESAARSVTWSDAGTEGCPSRDASPSVALSDAATDSPNREDARSAATHSVFRIIGRIGGTGWSDRARSAEPSRFVSAPLSDPALDRGCEGRRVPPGCGGHRRCRDAREQPTALSPASSRSPWRRSSARARTHGVGRGGGAYTLGVAALGVAFLRTLKRIEALEQFVQFFNEADVAFGLAAELPDERRGPPSATAPDLRQRTRRTERAHGEGGGH